MNPIQVTSKPHDGSPEQVDMFGKRVLILGLGTFGGGLGAARFCVQKGGRVTVTDLKSPEQLQHSLARLQGLKINFHLGRHDGLNFRDYDLVVVNPAVPRQSPWLKRIREAGVPTTSEMNLFVARCGGKIVGITGSNGKTTTAALTAHLLHGSDRKVWLGGNIGISLLEQVDQISEKDAVVLELSSFQLEDLHRIKKSPTVAVVTNLSPNHLDRHGNFEAYVAAKMAIFAYQKPRDITILNYDDLRCSQLQSQVPSRLAMYSTSKRIQPGGYIERGMFVVDLGKGPKPVCSVQNLKLPGAFNRSNALGAIIAAMVMRTPPEAIGDLLQTFKGVEHRLEPVGEFDGVKFYNDSVSTTPESTLASLSALTQQDVWLIVGGADKGLNYREFAENLFGTRVVGVVGVGQIGPSIVAEIEQATMRQRSKRLDLLSTTTIEEALDQLRSRVKPGQTVVLSPATASYDQFRNFEERGLHFKALSKNWRRGTTPATPPIGRRLSPDSLRVTESPGHSGTDAWAPMSPPRTLPHDHMGAGTAMWAAQDYQQPHASNPPTQPHIPPATPPTWDGPPNLQHTAPYPPADPTEHTHTERMHSPTSDAWNVNNDPAGFPAAEFAGASEFGGSPEFGGASEFGGSPEFGGMGESPFGSESGAPFDSGSVPPWSSESETSVQPPAPASDQPWGTDPWGGAAAPPDALPTENWAADGGGGVADMPADAFDNANWTADAFGSHEPAVQSENWASVEGDTWAESHVGKSNPAADGIDYSAFNAFDTVAESASEHGDYEGEARMSDADHSYFQPSPSTSGFEPGFNEPFPWDAPLTPGGPPVDESPSQRMLQDLANPAPSLFGSNLNLVDPMDSLQMPSFGSEFGGFDEETTRGSGDFPPSTKPPSAQAGNNMLDLDAFANEAGFGGPEFPLSESDGTDDPFSQQGGWA